MAEQTELLEVLSTQEAPISAGNLAKQANTKVENISTQLKRLKERGLVTSSEDGWSITDAGREALSKGKVPPSSMIEEKLTPYDQFYEIGKRIGLSEDRIKLASDMVFEGDYEDMGWVWEALGQQNLRNDVKNLWFNNWRIKVKKPVPEDIAEEVFASEKEIREKVGGKAEARRKEERDYILVDDMPVRVGLGIGDFDLQTAREMAALRALKDRFGAGGVAVAAQSPQSVEQRLPELITALAAFKEKPDQENVNALLKELQDARFDSLRQEITNQFSRIPQPQQQKSFMDQLTDLFASLGSLKEMGPTIRGVLGIPESHQESPTTSMLPIQLKDKEGNPLVMDIGALLQWKRFEGEERRADERHEEMKGLVKTVREVLPDGVAAIRDTATQLRGSPKAAAAGQTQSQGAQVQCSNCSKVFTPDLSKDTVKCPNPECGAEWNKSAITGS